MFYFQKCVSNRITQWVRALTTNLSVMSPNPAWAFIILTFPKKNVYIIHIYWSNTVKFEISKLMKVF